MTDKYEYLSHVLANYLSVSIGETEDAALTALREHMSHSEELATGVRRDIAAALTDPHFSWRSAFEAFDVATVESEASARAYALRLFNNI
jgi:hypothetical protein